MKIVIVCGDGAIRGGYVAGVFFALKKYCPKIWNLVTDFTASSSSVGGLFYEEGFKDENPGKKLWTQDFADPNFINLSNFFKGGKVYDIDYLVDTIFKKNNPCDISLIHKSKYGYYFPLIDYDSGNTVIFNNRGLTKKQTGVEYSLIEPKQIYEYIRAATAVPILYDSTVQIGKRRFIDAGIRMPYFINEHLFKNHKKIIISTNNPFKSSDGLACRFSGDLFQYLGPLVGAHLKSGYYEEIAKKSEKFQELKDSINYTKKSQNTFYVYPKEKLGGIFDNSEETLKKNFEQGEKDLIEQIEQLEKFI